MTYDLLAAAGKDGSALVPKANTEEWSVTTVHSTRGIHPFKLEQRVSDSDAIYEGLYVFDPGALGPQCSTVKLALYSDKEPDKADTRVIDPKIVQQIWQDFAPHRES